MYLGQPFLDETVSQKPVTQGGLNDEIKDITILTNYYGGNNVEDGPLTRLVTESPCSSISVV